jgi:Ca-activated chloride channel homolog
MSFEAPVFLLALLLVPAAVFVYVRAQAARRRAAGAFATPALMASVAPRPPGWRRHAPIVLYGVALTAGAVALARPEATVAVPEERATVILVTDQSGSMEATDVAPSRLRAARAAALDFLERVPEELRVGVVAFNHTVRAIQSPTTDRQEAREIVERLRSSGGTATGEGLSTALGMLERQSVRDRRRAPAAILLLSDGESTHGRDPMEAARVARRLGVPVHTVALGTPDGTIRARVRGGGTAIRRVPPDRETLQAIARTTRARAFEVEDAEELDTVYERLGSQVATRPERREISAAFAAGAMLCLVGGGLLSLRWFARLP